MTQAAFTSHDPFVPDALIAGNALLLVGRKITIASGRVLPRGAVIGRVTDTGKYVLSLPEATDGSQTPDLILAEPSDATDADREALAYARGDFNTRALTLGAGHTVASITEGLRGKGVTLLASAA